MLPAGNKKKQAAGAENAAPITENEEAARRGWLRGKRFEGLGGKHQTHGPHYKTLR